MQNLDRAALNLLPERRVWQAPYIELGNRYLSANLVAGQREISSDAV